MVGVEEFLEGLKAAPKPVGVGLITINPHAVNATEIICINNPKFMMPFPHQFDFPIRQVLAVPVQLIDDVIEAKAATPLEHVVLWWSYAIYE